MKDTLPFIRRPTIRYRYRPMGGTDAWSNWRRVKSTIRFDLSGVTIDEVTIDEVEFGLTYEIEFEFELKEDTKVWS